MFNFNYAEIYGVFFVFIRMTSFIITWPIFGSTLVPQPAKVLFGVALALILFPNLQHDFTEQSFESLNILLVIFREAFVGLIVGFLGRAFLFALNISGELISVSMGLSSSQLFNPSTGSQSSTIDQFQIMLVSLLFLAINGHHLFLDALMTSYKFVPLTDSGGIELSVFGSFGLVVQQVMLVGLKLGAPVMISILLMNIVMGIIGRAVPQINVLITSMPVNILVGFMVIVVSMPVILGQIDNLLMFSANEVFRFLKGF